jgi:hypothetical protein
MWAHDVTRVFAVSSVDLRVIEGTWAFADRHIRDIEAHWARRQRETPGFFNGSVVIMTAYAVSGDGRRLSAKFIRTDFRSFLYWRETGWRDGSVMDGFGSALILSADGRVLLGRQSEGNLNSGLCYPPSGFIDACDIGADGSIDIDSSVAREVGEETGLSAPLLSREDGYVVTIAGPTLSIAIPLRSPLAGDALLRAANHYISEEGSELAQFVLAAPGAPPNGLPMPDYARALLTGLPHLKIAV